MPPLAPSISNIMTEKYDSSEQIGAFKEFYEDLAMPKAEPHFDQDYSDEVSIKYEHIKILCNEARTVTEAFTAGCTESRLKIEYWKICR